MSVFDTIITEKNAKPIWRKLNQSAVPIVSDQKLKEIKERIDELRDDIKKNKYIPSIGHGYLGYVKQSGCTRFVPILSAEDMTVYYLLVLSLQDYLIKDFEGVYGAYRSVPKGAKKQENPEEEPDILDPYFSDTFSKKAWFKNWSQFTDLLVETCNDASVGNYVLTSDVANFYDTIDVNRLTNKIRSKVTSGDEVVSLLSYFLSFWDRRIKGYSPSSKGIPQEIISDASRIVSNFYLNEFDERFVDYCKSNSVLYIRWADDIVLFGKSRQQLENVMHQASRFLLNIGLNFNASKTKHYSRNQFRDYRALDLLQAVSKKNPTSFEKELRKFAGRYTTSGGRIDTVTKAALNFMSSEPKARSLFAMNYLKERFKEYELFSSLNESQLLKKYLLFGDITNEMRRDVRLITRHPYAAPRVTFLAFLSKHRNRLKAEGVAVTAMRSLIEQIDKSSGDSEITKGICVPAARNAVI